MPGYLQNGKLKQKKKTKWHWNSGEGLRKKYRCNGETTTVFFCDLIVTHIVVFNLKQKCGNRCCDQCKVWFSHLVSNYKKKSWRCRKETSILLCWFSYLLLLCPYAKGQLISPSDGTLREGQYYQADINTSCHVNLVE